MQLTVMLGYKIYGFLRKELLVRNSFQSEDAVFSFESNNENTTFR